MGRNRRTVGRGESEECRLEMKGKTICVYTCIYISKKIKFISFSTHTLLSNNFSFSLFYALPCYAVVISSNNYHSLLCLAVTCYSLLVFDMSCFDILSHDILFYDILSYDILSYIILYHDRQILQDIGQ